MILSNFAIGSFISKLLSVCETVFLLFLSLILTLKVPATVLGRILALNAKPSRLSFSRHLDRSGGIMNRISEGAVIEQNGELRWGLMRNIKSKLTPLIFGGTDQGSFDV